MVRQKTQVALSAHTFSGGRMLEELNEGIAEALEDCADGLSETPLRLGKRTVTVTLTLSSDGNGILKTTHKLDVKVPRPEVGDLAWLEGSGAVVDLRLDPGTTQLDLEVAISKDGPPTFRLRFRDLPDVRDVALEDLQTVLSAELPEWMVVRGVPKAGPAVVATLLNAHRG